MVLPPSKMAFASHSCRASDRVSSWILEFLPALNNLGNQLPANKFSKWTMFIKSCSLGNKQEPQKEKKKNSKPLKTAKKIKPEGVSITTELATS